jgi:hypothetical protein
MCYSLPIIFLYFIEFVILYFLIKGKKIITRGSPPKEILSKNLFEYDNKENEKKALIYYYELIRIQEGIDFNNDSNRKRHILYTGSFILSAIIFVSTSAVIILIIFRP